MRANEIIKGVLNLIDQIDCGTVSVPPVQAQPTQTTINIVAAPPAPIQEPALEPEIIPVEQPLDDESRRFRQILDILMHKDQMGMYANSPAEVVTGINSVTKDAGGGLNGPKNPSDIRADSISMYPGFQARPGA
jgi:hypothetical protein